MYWILSVFLVSAVFLQCWTYQCGKDIVRLKRGERRRLEFWVRVTDDPPVQERTFIDFSTDYISSTPDSLALLRNDEKEMETTTVFHGEVADDVVTELEKTRVVSMEANSIRESDVGNSFSDSLLDVSTSVNEETETRSSTEVSALFNELNDDVLTELDETTVSGTEWPSEFSSSSHTEPYDLFVKQAISSNGPSLNPVSKQRETDNGFSSDETQVADDETSFTTIPNELTVNEEISVKKAKPVANPIKQLGLIVKNYAMDSQQNNCYKTKAEIDENLIAQSEQDQSLRLGLLNQALIATFQPELESTTYPQPFPEDLVSPESELSVSSALENKTDHSVSDHENELFKSDVLHSNQRNSQMFETLAQDAAQEVAVPVTDISVVEKERTHYYPEIEPENRLSHNEIHIADQIQDVVLPVTEIPVDDIRNVQSQKLDSESELLNEKSNQHLQSHSPDELQNVWPQSTEMFSLQDGSGHSNQPVEQLEDHQGSTFDTETKLQDILPPATESLASEHENNLLEQQIFKKLDNSHAIHESESQDMILPITEIVILDNGNNRTNQNGEQTDVQNEMENISPPATDIPSQANEEILIQGTRLELLPPNKDDHNSQLDGMHNLPEELPSGTEMPAVVNEEIQPESKDEQELLNAMQQENWPPATEIPQDREGENGENDTDETDAQVLLNSEDALIKHIRNIVNSFPRRDGTPFLRHTSNLLKLVLRRPRQVTERRLDPFFEIQAPDLSHVDQKHRTPEQDDVYQSFIENAKAQQVINDDIITGKITTSSNTDGSFDVQVTGVLPFELESTKFRPGIAIDEKKPNEETLLRSNSSRDVMDSIRHSDPIFIQFLRNLPVPWKRAFFATGSNPKRTKRQLNDVTSTNCDWHIQTDPGLYLLVTFHNLSAPFSLDCQGAYIEVERENNGFQARWCGNKIGQQRGTRSHVIFARSDVRISIFDDGTKDREWPTGFAADAEVVDLYDAGQYATFRRSEAYSVVRRLAG